MADDKNRKTIYWHDIMHDDFEQFKIYTVLHL